MSKKYNAVANASQSASQTFVKGAAILTVSMVVVKVFGVLDKVILTNIYSMFGQSLASMGMGIYNNAYEVFGVIFTVATGGLPIVISRMISQNMAEERYKDVKQVHRVSIPLFLVVGLVCTIGLMLVSFPYAFKFVKSPYSIYAMLALAPTVLFGCIASIYRGYFEGQRNMFPTAVSEVIEAVVKLVLGAAFAYLIMYFGMAHYKETGNFLWFELRDQRGSEHDPRVFGRGQYLRYLACEPLLEYLSDSEVQNRRRRHSEGIFRKLDHRKAAEGNSRNNYPHGASDCRRRARYEHRFAD